LVEHVLGKDEVTRSIRVVGSSCRRGTSVSAFSAGIVPAFYRSNRTAIVIDKI
jgi:hypothetical protein